MNAPFRATAAVLAAAALLVPGCATTVVGTAAAPQDAPALNTSVAMPTTTPPPAKPISLESLVRSAVRTSALFWQTQGVDVEAEAVPVTGALTCASWRDNSGSSAVLCETTALPLVKYQVSEMESRRANGGDLAVKIIVAHEVGHAAQVVGGFTTAKQDSVNAELAADCASGAALADAGVARTDAEAAIPATALGKKNKGSSLTPEQRTGAFFAGFDGTISPMGCFSYEG